MNANCIRCDGPDRLRSGYCADCERLQRRAPARHTPGPWHRNIPPATKYATIFAGRNTHVAIIQSSARMAAEEIEGNANLIASAPCLLAALRRAAHYMQNCGASMDRDYPEIGAAIARAEGRTPATNTAASAPEAPDGATS